MWGGVRGLRSLVLAAALITAPLAAAEADSALCGRLQDQYISLGQQSSASDSQLSQVRNDLDNVRNQARSAGCTGGFLFFSPKPSRQCPAIMAHLRQAQHDYARLGGGGGLFNFFGLGESDAQVQRDHLRDTLLSYGCDIPSGGYRTVCVRTCDGYYFPISFSTNRSRFAMDQAICQSMYGDGQAELYTYHNPGGDPDQMTSLTGEPYATKPFAFSYRSTYSPSCAAQLWTGLAALAKASRVTVSSAGAADQLLPLPLSRPVAGEDPETVADAEGALTLRATPTEQGPEVAETERSIRTIGPAYYYAAPVRIDGLGRKPVAKPANFSLIDPAQATEMPPKGDTSRPN